MFIFLFSMIMSADDTVVCSDLTNDKCEGCLGLSQSKCGWCYDESKCMTLEEGNANCTTSFVDTFDMECHINSLEPLSTGARIGIAVFSIAVAVITFVFWVFIFPVITRSGAETHANE